MKSSRWLYYLRSIPTLLLGLRNWPAILLALLTGRRPILVRLWPGHRFLVHSPLDIWIIKETCLDQDYERISEAIRPGWTVVDIGAALGDFTVHAARKAQAGPVIACEPFPASYALMQENIALNGLENVRTLQSAISGESGTLQLDISTGEAVLLSTTAQQGDSALLQVPAITLDALFADQAITHCDFLKIDTEGAEFDILMQASPATLAAIDRICLEYHNIGDHNHDDLATFLRTQGYTVTIHPNPVHNWTGLIAAIRV